MPTLLTPEETAERLRVKVRTVTTWLRGGFLPGVKVGHFWRVPEDGLEQFIKELQSARGASPG